MGFRLDPVMIAAMCLEKSSTFVFYIPSERLRSKEYPSKHHEFQLETGTKLLGDMLGKQKLLKC